MDPTLTNYFRDLYENYCCNLTYLGDGGLTSSLRQRRAFPNSSCFPKWVGCSFPFSSLTKEFCHRSLFLLWLSVDPWRRSISLVVSTSHLEYILVFLKSLSRHGRQHCYICLTFYWTITGGKMTVRPVIMFTSHCKLVHFPEVCVRVVPA